MMSQRWVAAGQGEAFEDGDDRGRILVSGQETDGRYSLMSYSIAARSALQTGEAPAFGAHRHNDIEETFFVCAGRLRFLLNDEVFDLGPGDFVRVPPGTRHGFANVSGAAVDLLVGFYPGGFEELFLRHRTDQDPPPPPLGFVEDAVRAFNSRFEDFPDIR